MCGEAEGYQHMVLCDTCSRPYHLQCCQPPRNVVPPGKWHCHVCTQAVAPDYLSELRSADTVPFPRAHDAYHPEHAHLVALYVQGWHAGMQLARAQLGADAAPQRLQAQAMLHWQDVTQQSCRSDVGRRAGTCGSSA